MDVKKDMEIKVEMDIREEMDMNDFCLVETTYGHFLNATQYSASDVKNEGDPPDLREVSMQNGSTDDMNQEIDLEPNTFLNSINTYLIDESQNSNINFEENSVDFNKLKIKCNTCGIKLKNESALKRHLTSHTNERPFKCSTCPTRFKHKGDLKKHFVTHSDKKNFECEICQRKFKRKKDLNKHSLTHSDNHNFECKICNSKFKRKDVYKMHLVKHSNKYDFECNVCHKHFKRKDDLKLHSVRHSNKYDFKCNICHKKFKLKRYLKNHLLVTHSVKNEFDHGDDSRMHLKTCSFKKLEKKDINKELVIVLYDCLHKTPK